MTSGSRLEIVSSSRSVGGFQGVRAYSEVFWPPTPRPPGGEVNDARVGSQKDCFVMPLIDDDAFSHGVMRWTVYPIPAAAYGS
jgi:hypothetical protein